MDGRGRDFPLELNENCEQLVSHSDDDQVSDEGMQEKEDYIMVDVPKPKLGMIFESDSKAYKYYDRYAKNVGFRVRKNSTTHRMDKTISRRLFCCSKEGFRRTHTRGPSLKARAPTRVGCKARLQIKLLGDGKYSVVEFIKEHNHELGASSKEHSLKLKRKAEISHAEVVEEMHDEETRSTTSYLPMGEEVGAFPTLNSTQLDGSQHMQRRGNEVLEKGDAQFLLDYLQRMQKENPYFLYFIRMSDDNQLGCCFWCDAKSRIDYSFFGDVVCFDTTYKTNDYEKPYAPFVGLNNHGQFVLFGCALLLDESLDSITWLFRTFLDAMGGKQPTTMFTEQAVNVVDAIERVFSSTHHRLSLWHIYQDSLKHLSHVSEKSKSFTEEFKGCIYNGETEEGFQSSWDALLNKYNLLENEWLLALYQMRKKWVPAYGREYFSACVTTLERSEGMSKFLKKYVKRFMPLRQFVIQYEKALSTLREKEKHQDLISKKTKPDLRTRWPAEAQAAERYTRKIFKLFQDEYVGTLDLLADVASEDGSLFTYKVSSFQSVRPFTVTFDTSKNTIECSCKRFEFMGVLCAHALKVLHNRRSHDIPSPYYLNRWTQDATVGVVVDNRGQPMHANGPSSLAMRHSELVHMALTVAAKASTSEKCSVLAKEVLTRVLREIDDLLKFGLDQGVSLENDRSANHVNLGNDCVADHLGANVGMGKQNGSTEKIQPRLTGSQVSVGVVGTVSSSSLASPLVMPNHPVYPVRPGLFPHYAQAIFSNSGTSMAHGLICGGWRAPSWHGKFVPMNVVGVSGASTFQGTPLQPTGLVNGPLVPPLYPNVYNEGLAKVADQAASHHGHDTTPSIQERR